LLNHGPKNRGTAQIFISEDGSQTLPAPDRKPSLRLAHIILMYIAFAVLAPVSAVVARYARGLKNELWFKVHRIVVLVEFVCSLLGLFVILGGVKEGHFQTANHAQLGIAVLAMNLVMIFMGIWRIKTPEPEDTDTTLWRVWYQFHRWIGRIMIVLATAAIFSGMYEYGSDQFFYGWHAGLVATFITFIFFAEFRTWKRMNKKVEAV
jgi:TRAP-type C4-dicarboxylate transport system permease large subunit